MLFFFGILYAFEIRVFDWNYLTLYFDTSTSFSKALINFLSKTSKIYVTILKLQKFDLKTKLCFEKKNTTLFTLNIVPKW